MKMRIFERTLICLMLLFIFSISSTTPKIDPFHTKYISSGHAKVAIVGAGLVGSTVAYALMLKNIVSELILVDVADRVEGEVLDLSDALYSSTASKIRRADLKNAAQADIIIISAGTGRKTGQSRLDLIKTNQKIITSIVKNLHPLNPHAIILVISNPVDIMTYIVQQLVDLPKSQVFGSGTFLDTQRLCDTISKKVGISQQSIAAYILGEHGDSQFPAWSSAQIGGIPIVNFPGITLEILENCAKDTITKGRDIIEFKGATYYGIGSCVAQICQSIIFDQKSIIPVSCFDKGLNVCLSLPTVIGENGAEQVLRIPLKDKEREKLAFSAESLKNVIDQLIIE